MIRVTLFRFDPDNEKAPRFETHVVPHEKGMTILDALFYVYENIDRSLAFNFGCRYGRCGMCAVNVNGKPKLICQTLAISDMVLEPLPNYPVVRDLVIERAKFGERTLPFQPFLQRRVGGIPSAEMHPDVLKPKELDIFVKSTRCVDCFSCNSICPVIGVTQETKRGPNLLIQMAPYLFDPRDSGRRTAMIEGLTKMCLLCGTCAENCPKNLPIDEIIFNARAEIVTKTGLPLSKTLVLQMLQSPRLLSVMLKGGSLLRGLFFKRIPAESGLQLRFPIGKMDPRRVLPDLAKRFFLEKAPGEVGAPKENKKVAFFVGCSINYLYPQIGEASIRVLNRRGVSVKIPKEQKCCGLPAYGSGDLEVARKLALANIEAFEKVGVDQVLVACGSCGAHLKKHLPKLFVEADTGVQERVAKFSDSIMDLTAYLASQISVANAPQSGKNLRVTYHDSCHMRRKLGVTEEPRTILRSIAKFIEMEGADRCCGLAGSFGLENYDLSAKILTSKMEKAQKTGAEVLVTGCMGCLMQMQQGVHNHHLNMKIQHTIELLDEVERECEKVNAGKN